MPFRSLPLVCLWEHKGRLLIRRVPAGMKLTVWVLNKVLLTLWAEAKDQRNAFFLEIAPWALLHLVCTSRYVIHVDLKRQDKKIQTYPVSLNKGNTKCLSISRPLCRPIQLDKHFLAGPMLGARDTKMNKAKSLPQVAHLLIDERKMKPKLAQSGIHFIIQASITDDIANKSSQVGRKKEIKKDFSGEKPTKYIYQYTYTTFHQNLFCFFCPAR